MTTQTDNHIDSVVDGAAFSFLATFNVVAQNEVKRISKQPRGTLKGTCSSPGWTCEGCRNWALTYDRLDEAQESELQLSQRPSQDQSCWLRVHGRSSWKLKTPFMKPRGVHMVSAANLQMSAPSLRLYVAVRMRVSGCRLWGNQPGCWCVWWVFHIRAAGASGPTKKPSTFKAINLLRVQWHHDVFLCVLPIPNFGGGLTALI